jgi:hypothetical protein
MLNALAVSLATIADARDLNCRVFVLEVEEQAIVATTQTKASKRRLQSHNVPAATGEVAVEAMQDINGGGAIEGTQVRASFW